jgi:hypothetical protein
VPAAADDPSETPAAPAVGGDAAASEPAVAATHHVDTQAAAPAHPATVRPSSGSSTTPSVPPRPAPLPSGPRVPSGAPDEPRPTPPAHDAHTATPSNGEPGWV